MRHWEVGFSQLSSLAGHAGALASRNGLEAGGKSVERNAVSLYDSQWNATPDPCSYYGMGSQEGCVPAHSAVVYFVTGVAGMAFLLAITIFFVCCFCLRKRQRDQAEAAFQRQQAQTAFFPTINPLFLSTNSQGATDSVGGPQVAAVPVESKNPNVCVIMAGEDKPTFLAHPVGCGSDLHDAPAELKDAGDKQNSSKPGS